MEDDDGPLTRFDYLEDLLSHRYFRHTVPVLKEHPFAKDLIACHAAVLVKKNSIISIGCNKPKHHGLVRAYAPHENMTIHAEVDCLLKARKKHDLTGCTMYVARVQKTDTRLSMSKPCSTCHEILNRYGVKHVYYTTLEDGIQYVNIKNKYEKTENWKYAA